jgi:hypothetical protein
MSNEWYYSRNDEQFGPVTLDQLRQLVLSNELIASDLVWNETMPEWGSANTVPELFESTEWFYSKGDEKHGPLSTSDLKSLAESGALSADDLVWKDGFAQWQPASKVRGLFPNATNKNDSTPSKSTSKAKRSSTPASKNSAKFTSTPKPLWKRWWVWVVAFFIVKAFFGGGKSGYVGALDRIEKLRESKLQVLVKKYGDESDIPKSEKEKFVDLIEAEANKILATYGPITATSVDESAAGVVSQVKMDGHATVMPLGFFGWHVRFPIKVLAEASLPKSEYDNRLVMKVYDANKTALQEDGVDLKTNASRGEWVSGNFTIEIGHLDKVAEMKLFKKKR